MKKVLTILLTLVMAICLINLNNSHTKAEDVDDTPVACNGLRFTASHEWFNGDSSVPANKLDAAGLANFGIVYDSATNTATFSKSLTTTNGTTLIIWEDLNIILKNSISINTTNNQQTGPSAMQNDKNLHIYGNGKILTINSDGSNPGTGLNNRGNIILEDVTVDILHGTKWYSMTNKNLELVGNCVVNLINNYSSAKQTYTTALIVEESLTIPNGSIQGALLPSGDLTTVTKKAQGFYQVETSPGTFENAMKIKMTNSAVKHEFDCSTTACKTNVKTDEIIDQSAKINLDYDQVITRAHSVQRSGELNPLVEGRDYILTRGSTVVTLKKAYLESLPAGDYTFVASLNDGTAHSYNINVEISDPVAPTPSPSPSEPKDESCEKVIGPSWHWNNDKGICEDYGVVGTSTR